VKVWVTGHRGILGRALLTAFAREGVPAVGTDVAEVDITAAAAVRDFVRRERPSAVINCAAFTRVDDAERERGLCFRVNAEGAGIVAAAASESGARIIQLSTDYVFDGSSREPYGEDAAPGPRSVYGASKFEGERQVAAAHNDYVIVRTAWLFGVGGANFVAKVLARAKRGERLDVVADQRGSPTYAGHLAWAIMRLLQLDYRGIIHIAGAGVASWFDVAAEVLAVTARDVPLTAVPSAALGQAASRPAYSALDCSRYADLTGRPMPRWREGVRAYLEELGEVAAGAC